MIHIIWAVLMLASFLFSVFSGTLSTMTTAIMDGAKEAVNLCRDILDYEKQEAMNILDFA